MDTQTMLATLEEVIRELGDCCLHHPLWKIAEVEEIVAWYAESPEGYDSEERVVLVKLKDGYGVLTSYADTSGHGCVCDSFTARSDTLDGALSYLPEREIELLLDPAHGTLAGDV